MMTLIQRLAALAQRREDEGLYTDADIASKAIDRIVQLQVLLMDVQRDLGSRDRDPDQSILLGKVSAAIYMENKT